MILRYIAIGRKPAALSGKAPKDLTEEELRPYYNEWMRRLMAARKARKVRDEH